MIANGRRLFSEALDAFLLRDAERISAARTPVVEKAVARLHAAATRRITVADGLSESRDAAVAIRLYREACVILCAAALASRAGDASASVAIPPSAEDFDAFEKTLTLPQTSAWTAVRDAVRSDDPLLGDALEPAEADDLQRKLASAASLLLRGVDPRTPRQLRVARVIRIIVSAIAIVVLLWWSLSILLSTPNVALRKPVRASSLRGMTDGSGFTNGNVESTYGVHTETEASPWISVDLGSVMSLSKVKVYGRGDGWANESVPLVLEISVDGETFTEVDRRADPVGQFLPWTSKRDGEKARWVRVRLPRQGYIALSEIEVFAK